MQKILIVEDDLAFQEMYKHDLEGFDLLQARTLEQGRKSFERFGNDLAAIVLDGSLGNNEFGDTLAREIRDAGYTGPMIATSTSMSLNDRLRLAGCDYGITSKSAVGEYLKSCVLPKR